MGAREHYLAPRALERAGHLRLFYTEAWCGHGRDLLRRGPGRIRAFAGRHHPEIPAEKIVSFTPSAICRETLRARLWGHLPEHGHLKYRSWYARRVAADLRKREFDPDRDVFFGYNTECLEILPMLRERGIRIILGQVDPGRVEGELVREEMKRWPGWETNPGWISNEYYDRTEAEWELADAIVVNSEWSKQCLLKRGVPDKKIHIIPLAYEAVGRRSRGAAFSRTTHEAPFDGRARPPGAPSPLRDAAPTASSSALSLSPLSSASPNNRQLTADNSSPPLALSLEPSAFVPILPLADEAPFDGRARPPGAPSSLRDVAPTASSSALSLQPLALSLSPLSSASSDNRQLTADNSSPPLALSPEPSAFVPSLPLADEAPFDGRARPPGAPSPLRDVAPTASSSALSLQPLALSLSPLRVLFLATVCLRKGIQYLIEAARQLQDEPITFTVAGPIHISQEAVRSAPPNVRFLGPVSRDQVSDLYREADVYVLPTVSDGFAMTQLEAMAHGLPVITTSYCGDVVTHGLDGYISPVGDSPQLVKHLVLLSKNGTLLYSMQQAAAKKVDFTTLNYTASLLKLGNLNRELEVLRGAQSEI